MSTDQEPVLYAEPGSTWWPLLWAPGFAVGGIVFDAVAGGPGAVLVWLAGGVVVLGCVLVIVRSRRGMASVRVTPHGARFGQEVLPVAEVSAVDDVGASVGARVLGGGWFAPRRTEEVPLRLHDGSTVLGWARDPDALRDSLRPLLEEP